MLNRTAVHEAPNCGAADDVERTIERISDEASYHFDPFTQ